MFLPLPSSHWSAVSSVLRVLGGDARTCFFGVSVCPALPSGPSWSWGAPPYPQTVGRAWHTVACRRRGQGWEEPMAGALASRVQLRGSPRRCRLGGRSRLSYKSCDPPPGHHALSFSLKGHTFQCCERIVIAKQCCPGVWQTSHHLLVTEPEDAVGRERSQAWVTPSLDWKGLDAASRAFPRQLHGWGGQGRGHHRGPRAGSHGMDSAQAWGGLNGHWGWRRPSSTPLGSRTPREPQGSTPTPPPPAANPAEVTFGGHLPPSRLQPPCSSSQFHGVPGPHAVLTSAHHIDPGTAEAPWTGA